MQKISIILVDDHTLVRETWSFILSHHPQFNVIGEAGNGAEGIELAKKLQPDIVILDINLPGMNGIEATRLIHKDFPNMKIIGVSLHTQPTYARKMMQVGARGYVTKNSTKEEMFEAIIEVQKGNTYICREIKDILSGQVFGAQIHQETVNDLSQRELEIIGYIQKGCSSKEIAEALHIAVKTVEVHRYNILKKLNLKNTAALVNFMHSQSLELRS